MSDIFPSFFLGGQQFENPGGSSGVDMIMLPMIYGMDISEVLEVLVVGCSAGSLEKISGFSCGAANWFVNKNINTTMIHSLKTYIYIYT